MFATSLTQSQHGLGHQIGDVDEASIFDSTKIDSESHSKRARGELTAIPGAVSEVGQALADYAPTRQEEAAHRKHA